MCSVLSCVQFFASPWTAACQASLSVEYSRQEDLDFELKGCIKDEISSLVEKEHSMEGGV